MKENSTINLWLYNAKGVSKKLISFIMELSGRHFCGKSIGSPLRAILLTGSLLTSFNLQATQVIETNVAQIPVADQSQRSQDKAVKAAFERVMVKMSGKREVLDNPGVSAAMRTPQAYLRSYRYAYEGATIFYVAEFDKPKLNDLLQRESLPLWGERRPETILWLAIEDETGERSILDESAAHPLHEVLRNKAKQRGLPLSLPLMDLTDSATISIYDVWGRFIQPLTNASSRYSVDNVIGARLYENKADSVSAVPGEKARLAEDKAASGATQPSNASHSKSMQFNRIDKEMENTFDQDGARDNGVATNGEVLSGRTGGSNVAPFTMDEFTQHAQRADNGAYALDWVFVGGGQITYGSIFADDPNQLSEKLVNAYANYLSSQYAIIPGQSDAERVTIDVSIANIDSITSYANATSYLNSLSVVERAALVKQQGSVATFSVTLLGTAQDLLNTVQLESRLRPVTDAYGQAVQSYTFYWSDAS